jgi:hypothetical protein
MKAASQMPSVAPNIGFFMMIFASWRFHLHFPAAASRMFARAIAPMSKQQQCPVFQPRTMPVSPILAAQSSSLGGTLPASCRACRQQFDKI